MTPKKKLVCQHYIEVLNNGKFNYKFTYPAFPGSGGSYCTLKHFLESVGSHNMQPIYTLCLN